MTTKQLARVQPEPTWTEEQQRIIREQFADGCTDDELMVLLYQAKRRGLDPLLGQIRGIKRWNADKQRKVMAVQTSIDGFRVIAERTGRYGGSSAPEFRIETDDKGRRDLICRMTVRKLCGGLNGAPWTWQEVSDEARYSEYVVLGKNGQPVPMWKKMRYNQTAKCAEAKTLRKGFPEDLSGLYTDDEMAQADNPESVVTEPPPTETEPERKQPPKEPGAPPKPQPPPNEQVHKNGTVREVPEAARGWRCSTCRVALDPSRGDRPDLLFCAKHVPPAGKRDRPQPPPNQMTRDGDLKSKPDQAPRYVPDEFQRKRFAYALRHNPKMSDETRAAYVARGSAAKSDAEFNAVCAEMEIAAGLTKQEKPKREKVPAEKSGAVADPDDLPF